MNQEKLLPGTYIYFSDCMNNGDASQLYIDFNPSEQGVSGQIIRYVHDLDEFKIIVNSFNEYLKSLVDCGFEYLLDEED